MTVWVFDSEVYFNYYLAMFRNIETGEVNSWELFNGSLYGEPRIPDGTIITFNGRNFDMPILAHMMAGANNAQLKHMCDEIILRGMKPWDLANSYPMSDLSFVDHIDLIEVAPGTGSLKIYGGRMHSQRLQDLPIEPNAIITDKQRSQLNIYCLNDLRTTEDLYRELKPQIELRAAMSKEFGIDLRSKSDAQIAEAVIRAEVEKALGTKIYRPEIHPSYTFQYRKPQWVSFDSPGMMKVLAMVEAAAFTIDGTGSVVMPASLDGLRIQIGQGVYQMGIGGLHSTESCSHHVTDATTRLTDFDVTSYYPEVVLTQNLYPSHMGPTFLAVYKDLVARRISAKKAGDSVTNEVLKIVINGSFGKFGSKWSILYAPDLMIQVTITGQLALLMLIEDIETAGMQVVSANTDGVTVKYSALQRLQLNKIVDAWQQTTSFTLEESEYCGLFAKDVNNYIAIKTDGSPKQKGLYSFIGSKKSRLEKNPTNQVCIDAVIAYIANGIPLDQTIRQCSDIRRFLSVRKVEGGAKYKEQFLGRVVRWYYSFDPEPIYYCSNNHKVPRTDYAMPMMELAGVPDNVNYGWYIEEAKNILKDIGYA